MTTTTKKKKKQCLYYYWTATILFLGGAKGIAAFATAHAPHAAAARPLFGAATRVQQPRAVQNDDGGGEHKEENDDEAVYTIDDSFNLIVLGDLHMEDDMTPFEEARQHCCNALEELSLLPSVTTKKSSSSSSSSSSSNDKNDKERPTVKELLQEYKRKRAGDLTVSELQMLLAQAQHEGKGNGGVLHSSLVSLGDLGRKDIRHEPGDAGTTKSFQDACDFLTSFGLPLNVLTGNHDLEGLDEFDTDEANLQAWMRCFGPLQSTDGSVGDASVPVDTTTRGDDDDDDDDKKDKMPCFARYVGRRTLLLGLSTVRFRDAPYSSHEVHVDNDQMQWFQRMVEQHSAEDGWKILVFTHAPPMGSGLRVLQNVHIKNACAWVNHSSPPDVRSFFYRMVQRHDQIKLWCSGHFHLSHEYEDSISCVNACTFVQVGVMGPKSCRDGQRQSRLIRGCADKLQIYTLHHHLHGKLRLDAEMDLQTNTLQRRRRQRQTLNSDGDDDDDDNDDTTASTSPESQKEWFRAYVPAESDGCYIDIPEGPVSEATTQSDLAARATACWWHMKDGCVLGLHEGQLVEYDAETLSPLGIVVPASELGGRQVMVVQEGTAVVLVGDSDGDGDGDNDHQQDNVEVVHPNEDGSYWRKFQRNKRVRQEELAREAIAKEWLQQQNKL